MNSNVLKISIIAIMLVFVYTTVVSALSFTPSMTPSSTVVPEATEFTVEVKVSNLDVGPDGINTMSGVLEYEDKVFEKISASSIEGLNSFETKQELGDAYNMVLYGGAKYEWYVQTNSFCKYIVGKTAEEVTGISVDESAYPTDPDLPASVTIAIGGYKALVAEALQ